MDLLCVPPALHNWKAGEKSPLHIKRMKNVCIQLASDGFMTGTILFLSQTFPAGKYTDQRIWNDYKLHDHFVGKAMEWLQTEDSS
jgi:hypothetical protein